MLIPKGCDDYNECDGHDESCRSQTYSFLMAEGQSGKRATLINPINQERRCNQGYREIHVSE